MVVDPGVIRSGHQGAVEGEQGLVVVRQLEQAQALVEVVEVGDVTVRTSGAEQGEDGEASSSGDPIQFHTTFLHGRMGPGVCKIAVVLIADVTAVKRGA